MYTDNSRFIDFYNDVKQFQENLSETVCNKATTWADAIIKANRNITFGQVLLDRKIDEAWAMWVLNNYYEKLNDRLVRAIMRLIKHPMSAFQFYMKHERLAKNHEKIIINKFKGKLPKAEKELKNNVVKRTKDKTWQ